MSDSESSALSSPPASDDERLAPIFLNAKGKKIQKKVKKVNVVPPTPPSPPRPKRSPSPEHEEVLADDPDVAFIIMFRSRFSASFPPKLGHVGPQDIERGVVDTVPSPQVENLLCAILALALNRKKPIERGHHARAIEEAISVNKHQWPKSWNGSNPLPGSKTFNDLGPVERLHFLKTLIIWSLTSSEEISKTIKNSYKQSRQEDDLNQPLSVQPWGIDDDKRKYWLVEGQDDTSFRLYREGNRTLKKIPWRSVAGTIDEVRAVAQVLEHKHHTQASKRLAGRIHAAIPRFEATEDKRRRREYRQVRRAQFTRPEPGFSLYEGRTRGAKRVKYTFDDDDDDGDNFDSDAPSTRRSNRNHSNGSTPVDSGPVMTASGRTVRPRGGGMYGESLLSGQTTGADTGSYAVSETSDNLDGPRATRAGRRSSNLGAHVNGIKKRKHPEGYGELSDESDAEDSGDQWDGGDDFEEDKGDAEDSEDEDDMSVDDEEDDLLDDPKSLIVKLKVRTGSHDSNGAPSGIKSGQEIDTKLHPTTEAEEPATPGASSTKPTIPATHVPQHSSKQEGFTEKMENMDVDPNPLPHSLEQPAPSKPSTEKKDGPTHTTTFSDVPSAATADGVTSKGVHPPQMPAQTNGFS